MLDDEWVKQCAETVNAIKDALYDLCILAGELEQRIIVLEQSSRDSGQ